MYPELLEVSAETLATTERVVFTASKQNRHSTLSGPAPEELLAALQRTRTDLAKLVRRVHQRDLHIVVVSTDAIARWQTDAAGAWERVQDWLRTQGVRVIQC
jgi:hypothetical protein